MPHSKLPLLIVLLALAACGFFWTREPALQVGPHPEHGSHTVWHRYNVAGWTLARDAMHSVSLPEGTYVMIPFQSNLQQEDFPLDDSLQTVSR